MLSTTGEASPGAAADQAVRWSKTPTSRWLDAAREEAQPGAGPLSSADALEQWAALLEATREKRRLTIDWRGGMMTSAELIDATARRVGLEPPRLDKVRGTKF